MPILDTASTRKKKIAERRLAICKSCEHLKFLNRCSQCGCFMDGKTLFMDAKCPIGKWNKETINMDEPFDFGEK